MRFRIIILSLTLISIRMLVNAQDCENSFFSHVRYAEIKQIFDRNACNSCHNSTQILWQYDTYENLLGLDGCSNNMVKHGDAGNSPLISVINGLSPCLTNVPKTVHQLSAQDIRKVEAWINTGAPEHCILPGDHISSLLDSYGCGSCHNSEGTNWKYFPIWDIDLLSKTYCTNNKIVSIYNAKESSLYQLLNNEPCVAGHQPIAMQQLHKEQIRDWINSGAPFKSISLPLQLLSFNTFLSNEKPNLLWATADEIGVEKFIIERSDAKFIKFQPLGTLPANGGSQQNYTFVDQEELLGDYYYRIKIVDIDGRHEYSPIKFIRLTSSKFELNIFPNPNKSSQSLYVKWYSKGNIQSTAHMELLDEAGRALSLFDIVNGTNKIQLPELPNGLYYLRLHDFYGSSYYERLVIMK